MTALFTCLTHNYDNLERLNAVQRFGGVPLCPDRTDNRIEYWTAAAHPGLENPV